MQTDLILQQPVTADGAELLLLFHGVGSSPEDLAPLGQALAAARPRAWVIGVRAANRSDFGSGWQWFSVQGIAELKRPERVAQALPAFVERVGAWQRRTGVGSESTTLIGFSQDATMSLESTQRRRPASPAAWPRSPAGLRRRRAANRSMWRYTCFMASKAG
jgi:phospholipase/carboxylesterase